jgi:nucleotide-binding universal stress UspA family protein
MTVIVVGVDGSEGSDDALRWALAEARLRGAPLRAVHVYQSPRVPVMGPGLGTAGGLPDPAVLTEKSAELTQAAETDAQNLIEEALRRVGGGSLEGLEIERSAVEGAPAQTLIESARDADLLVLGSRGRGGFLGLLLGSVSQQCAQHPPCPVVILPPEGTQDGG